MLARLRTGLRDRNGATATEFALVLPVFTMMVFLLIQGGMMMYMGASVQWALDRAARLVVTNPDATVGQIQAAMDGYLVAAGSPQVTVNYNIDDSTAVPVVRVSAHYDYEVEAPFVPSFTVGFDFQTLVPQPDTL